MRLAAIEGVLRRRRGKYGRRSVSTATAPDLVERNFTAVAPDQLWVADISYLRTWEGFVYLAVVVDAFSRKVVGWAMADHLRTELVLDSRRSIREVAAELGVNHETLRNWVTAERRNRAAGPAALGADERLELARLRRKVAELELEREILKKAAVFFARETGR